MNKKSIIMLVIFLVFIAAIIWPIFFYIPNQDFDNKLELQIMTAMIIIWVGLFINSIINKYMDN